MDIIRNTALILCAPNENDLNSETQLLYKQRQRRVYAMVLRSTMLFETQISQANSNDFVNNIIIIPSCFRVECC